MLTRRHMIAATSAALATPFAGFTLTAAQAQGEPVFRFGVIADPQYAPVPPRRTRFYAHSLWKLTETVEAFNKEQLQFVVTLGDIIDRHYESYGHIMPVYDKLKHPHFFVLGNHDFEVAADFLHTMLRTAGLKRAYYDFAGGGYRFVVLDGNDMSVFAHPRGSDKQKAAQARLDKLVEAKAANAQTWNGTLSEEQFAWLQTTLDAARGANEKVIVFCHYPVFPADRHNIWDDGRVVDLLTRYPNVVAYMNGHNHDGNYGQVGGKHFLNFRGMVETAAETAYAIVEVHPDRLEVKGFGREPNRTLTIAGV